MKSLIFILVAALGTTSQVYGNDLKECLDKREQNVQEAIVKHQTAIKFYNESGSQISLDLLMKRTKELREKSVEPCEQVMKGK